MRLERGRLIDAFVDGHKYIFGKRAVVYGEEDLVVGLAAFLAEIGVKPVLCASGGKSGQFEDAMARGHRRAPGGAAADHGRGGFPADRRVAAQGLAPDLLIGHSKGYTWPENSAFHLIRVGFPIHDRFGGQRVLHVGYRGAQMLLDRIVNAIIEQTRKIRRRLRLHVREGNKMNIHAILAVHPCFNADVKGTCGRGSSAGCSQLQHKVQLLQPQVRLRKREQTRRYQCGPFPDAGGRYLEQVLESEPRITVAGIAGPGDPFANPEETMQTLRIIRERFPHMLLCLSTNGLGIGGYLNEIAEIGVSHVTITVNAIDPRNRPKNI